MALTERLMARSAVTVLLGCLGAACSSAPPFSGWTPDRLYEHGQQAFDDGDFGEARRAFERLVLTFPGYERAVDARHFLAQAFFADSEFLSAVSEYTRIVQVYPDHPRSPEAWMGLCRSYAALSPHPQRDQQYTFQARTSCQNVANDFQGTPVGDSARAVAMLMNDKLAEKTYGEGHFYFQRDVYESAELVFLGLLQDFPSAQVAPRAILRLLEIYEDWGWADQQTEYRDLLLQRYPDSPEAALVNAPVTDSTSTVRSRAPPPGRTSRSPPSASWARASA